MKHEPNFVWVVTEKLTLLEKQTISLNQHRTMSRADMAVYFNVCEATLKKRFESIYWKTGTKDAHDLAVKSPHNGYDMRGNLYDTPLFETKVGTPWEHWE